MKQSTALALVVSAWMAAGGAWAQAGTGSSADSWQTVGRDRNRLVQLDRSSVREAENNIRVGWSRIVLPSVDALSEGFATIKALNRFDCSNRSFITVKRVYLNEHHIVLREEEVAQALPVFFGRNTVDERMWREVCRPPSANDLRRIATRANQVAQLPQPAAMASSAAVAPQERGRMAGGSATTSSQTATPRTRSPSPAQPSADATRQPGWQFDGKQGPEAWGKLRPAWRLCASGKQQSPINLQGGEDQALARLSFEYWPSTFRVIDTTRFLQLEVAKGMGVSVNGQRYELTHVNIHHPVYEHVDGLRAEAALHLHHRAASGQRLIVAILLQAQGGDHPVLAAALDNLPAVRGGTEQVEVALDLAAALPFLPAYYLYEGSLVTPPCSEGVLWVVMRQPGLMSPAQQALLEWLYPNAARPVQPDHGRKIFRTY